MTKELSRTYLEACYEAFFVKDRNIKDHLKLIMQCGKARQQSVEIEANAVLKRMQDAGMTYDELLTLKEYFGGREAREIAINIWDTIGYREAERE